MLPIPTDKVTVALTKHLRVVMPAEALPAHMRNERLTAYLDKTTAGRVTMRLVVDKAGHNRFGKEMPRGDIRFFSERKLVRFSLPGLFPDFGATQPLEIAQDGAALVFVLPEQLRPPIIGGGRKAGSLRVKTSWNQVSVAPAPVDQPSLAAAVRAVNEALDRAGDEGVEASIVNNRLRVVIMQELG